MTGQCYRLDLADSPQISMHNNLGGLNRIAGLVDFNPNRKYSVSIDRFPLAPINNSGNMTKMNTKQIRKFLRHLIPNHYVWSMIMALAGFGCLFWASTIHDPDHTRLIVKLLDHLGAAILVVGCFSAYEKAIAEHLLIRHVSELFSLKHSIRESGLETICPDASEFNYGNDFLTESPSLCLVFNDGKKWSSNHYKQLSERFKHEKFSTDVFLVNPQGPFLEILAEKTGDSPDRVRRKIERSISNFKDLYEESGKQGQLRIYYLNLFPTYTAFLNDKSGVVSWYSISSGRTSVPAFVMKNINQSDTFFEFVKNDIERLKQQSEIHFDSNVTPDLTKPAELAIEADSIHH